MVNIHGLTRKIPEEVKREVRKRSKFGCVICRAGLYDYEHIDPEYVDAKVHDPDHICCLCSSCHDRVTRHHFSKGYVRKRYSEIESADSLTVKAPFGFLEFHDGKAEIKIGGITYDPGVKSIVRYHGKDIFAISPATDYAEAGINAVFLDDEGNETLKIVNNEWQGVLDAWDIEIIGPKISVRKKKGTFALVIRLEAPSRIVIEYLDMRIRDAHILVSDSSYAVGRYLSEREIIWFHAYMLQISAPLEESCAIEFMTPFEAEWRDQKWIGKGPRWATQDNQFVTQSGLGVACKRMGVVVGANCLKFSPSQFAFGGPRPLKLMKRAVFKRPDQVAAYIACGGDLR
jgi:hypothetical protein